MVDSGRVWLALAGSGWIRSDLARSGQIWSDLVDLAGNVQIWQETVDLAGNVQIWQEMVDLAGNGRFCSKVSFLTCSALPK